MPQLPFPLLQLAVLNNSAAEDLGDQEALEAELERELAAAEEGEDGAAAAPTPATGKKKVGARVVSCSEVEIQCCGA